jgi:putative membrane protein
MITTWPFDPTVYAGLLALFFGHAWLARGVDDARRIHTVYFISGLTVLWVALETPIDTISDSYLDSVHMLQHVLLGFVAPPLMLLGLSPGTARRLARIPLVRGLTEPVTAQVIAGGVMIVWHIPALYDATLQNDALHVTEHLTFIAAGTVLYWPVLQVTGDTLRHPLSPGWKLLYLLVATIPQDGVALALLFSRDPFYAYYVHLPRLVAGLTALIDQTIAGAVLMVLGKATMAVVGLVVFFRWFGEEQGLDRSEPSGRLEGT